MAYYHEDEVGAAIESGEADALYDHIRESGVSDSGLEDEYEPVTLSFSQASWVMDMIIEVQVRRARATPKLEDGERDELLLRMADLLAAPENNVPFVPGVPNISIQQRNIKRDCLRDFVNKFKDR